MDNDGRVASSTDTVLAACPVCGQKEGCHRASQDAFERSDRINAPGTGPLWRKGSLGREEGVQGTFW